MRLRYTKHDGTRMEFQLGEQPITIGRSPDADIVLLDEKVSRIHCGIRLWDGDFYIKDLKSKNGTWVNGDRAEVAKMRAGDSVRVGSTTFTFDQDLTVGADTAIQEIEGAMDLGKGYTTILREIVHDADGDRKPAPAAAPVAEAEEAEPPRVPAATEEAGAPGGLPKRKPLKITIKRRT